MFFAREWLETFLFSWCRFAVLISLAWSCEVLFLVHVLQGVYSVFSWESKEPSRIWELIWWENLFKIIAAVLVWSDRDFLQRDSRSERDSEFGLEAHVVRRRNHCERNLSDTDDSTGWRKCCGGETSLHRTPSKLGKREPWIRGLV